MTTHAKLVIIGAGIVGASAAYHLTKFGWKDILVLEKGDLEHNPGSTSHAPGGVVAVGHSKLLTQMGCYSSDLYGSISPYSPDKTMYVRHGGLEIAISETRMQDLVRLHGEAISYGEEAHLLTPQEIAGKVPLFEPKAMVGGLFIPKCSNISGSHMTSALGRDAEATGGATFVGQTQVTDILVQNGRVTGVTTSNPAMPEISCEQVLVCTNIWAAPLREKYGVHLPLRAFEHQYIITDPLPEMAHLDRNNPDDEVIYPNARELDSAVYFRHHWDSYGFGSYWHQPHMVHPKAVGETAMHPFTPADFVLAWEQGKRLMPALSNRTFETKFNGMFAFSVDGMPIIGESHIGGLWAAVASWITHAGGVGKSVAEWMVHGETEWDMRQCHIHRFNEFATTQSYVSTITQKNYREIYDIIHPRQDPTEPRHVRLSPFAPRHDSMKADYTVFAGLELPNWFEENARLLEGWEGKMPARSGWAAQHWSPIQGAEHVATRDNVALFDLTGLSIIEVKGVGAVDFVNYLCSNEMDKPVGRIIYTCWLTPSGGVRRDLAVARLAEDCYWMFVGEGTRPQDMDWVQRHAPNDGIVAINDVSDSYTGLGLWGPNARKVLEKVTSHDVSNEVFPYFTMQWIEVGMARVLALRMSYAGELGWELHVPMDQALPVYDVLWEAGRAFGMVNAGMGAFDSLRLEKGYRLWGGDVHTEYNPYESGLGWTVRLQKEGDFVGKAACVALKKQPLKKKLCCLLLDDPNAVVMGYEPIMQGDDCLGYVTTGNFGYSIGKFIAYGYLPVDKGNAGTKVEIIYFGERFGATVAVEPLYDPKMARLKA